LEREPSGVKEQIRPEAQLHVKEPLPSYKKNDTNLTALPNLHDKSQELPWQTGQSWKKEYQRLSDEIKMRHYSPKTLILPWLDNATSNIHAFKIAPTY
jgi:hypothetical protein